MKSDETTIREELMRPIKNTTELIGIEDQNIKIFTCFLKLTLISRFK